MSKIRYYEPRILKLIAQILSEGRGGISIRDFIKKINAYWARKGSDLSINYRSYSQLERGMGTGDPDTKFQMINDRYLEALMPFVDEERLRNVLESSNVELVDFAISVSDKRKHNLFPELVKREIAEKGEQYLRSLAISRRIKIDLQKLQRADYIPTDEELENFGILLLDSQGKCRYTYQELKFIRGDSFAEMYPGESEQSSNKMTLVA